jgi:hypothetical protein
MGEDEEHVSVLAAKQQLQRSLRHFDRINPVADRIVYENLARRDIDISLSIRGYTLSALLAKSFKVDIAPSSAT